MKKLFILLKVYSRFYIIFALIKLKEIFFSKSKNKKLYNRLIWYGAYGNTNIGDDLIFFSLKKYIPKNIEILLSCRQINATTNYGVRTFYRSGYDQYKHILNSDVVLLGGGGLFEYYRTSFPETFIMGYLYPLLMARYHRKKYAIVGMGCNIDKLPLRLRILFGSLTRKAEFIITRDEKSYMGFLNNGTLKNNLHSSYDPVLNYKEYPQRKNVKNSKVTVGFLIWPFFMHPYFHKCNNIKDIYKSMEKQNILKHNKFCEDLKILFSLLNENKIELKFPIFHFSDKVLLDELSCQYTDIIDFKTYFATIEECDIIISMRYHGQITSLASNKPTISIMVQEKMEALVENFDLSEFAFDIEQFDPICCMQMIETILKNENEIKSKIQKTYIKLSNQVEIDYTSNMNKLFEIS